MKLKAFPQICIFAALGLLALIWIITPLRREDLRVVDGDTVAIGAARIRLLGFDAPESWRPRCDRERALGAAAKLRLIFALRIARSGKIMATGARDVYGRELAHLLVDGRDVADAMIAEGYARAYLGGRRESWCGN